MANRNFFPNALSLEIDHVHLYASIVVGDSGAVTSFAGKGIASVTKATEAGRYTIALEDSYNRLLDCAIQLVSAVASNPSTVAVTSRVRSADVVNATAPLLVIQGYALDDGADANYADGANILVHITLRNSSVS